MRTRREAVSAPAVLLAVFLIGTCGLIYELIAGTLASYVLGDSVTQFSTIIGVYLFAMGVGAWISGFVDRDVVVRFIEIEIAIAILGGASSAILFLSFSRLSFFHVILYGLVLLIGALVGLEIPLLMRILKDRYDLKDLIARVLTADYLGALVASLLFPLFLVPKLGLVRGAFFVGCLNALVAVWCTHLLADALGRRRLVWLLRGEAYACLVVLLIGLWQSDAITRLSEDAMYSDPIVFAKTTPYQRVVVTQGRTTFQLYINSNLQLTGADEFRYHEALVHPAFGVFRERTNAAPKRVLILGGGDGLAAREVLRHDGVEEVTLVDLDPVMTDLGRSLPMLAELNEHALDDPRVSIVNRDAMIWLRDELDAPYDVIVVDFPDPSSFSLGKLYTTRFYRLLARALVESGVAVVQSTSPVYARRSFWCIASTMEAVGLVTRGYHASVPSFGEWGYVLASRQQFDIPRYLPGPLKFLTSEAMAAMFVFTADTSRVPTEVNSLNNQVLVAYYDEEWSRWH